MKCSQPEYTAYGLTFSRLTQHSRRTAERYDGGNLGATPAVTQQRRCILRLLVSPFYRTAPVRNTPLSVLAAKRSEVLALDRLGTSAFMGKPPTSGLAALLGEVFFSLLISPELKSAWESAPAEEGAEGAERAERRWLELSTQT